MATQVQFRGGTTAQNDAFTGASKELTVDTDKDVVVVHDGATAGGHPLMAEDGSNSELALGSAGTPALKFTDTNTGIYSPGADQIALSTGGTGRLFIDGSGNTGVGISSPAAKGHISKSYSAPTGGHDSNLALIVSNSGSANNYTGIGIAAGNNAASFIHFGDTDDDNVGALNYYHDTNSLALVTAASECVRINSSGQMIINGTSPLDNTKQLTLTSTTTSGGLGILSPNNGRGDIFFGDAADDNVGQIKYNHVDDSLTIRTNAADRFTIDSSGNVAVGTASPQAQFVISNSGAQGIEAGYSAGTSTNFIQAYNRSSSAFIQLDVIGNPLVFKTGAGATEAAQIDSSGRLLVGTSSSLNTAYKLQIAGETDAAANVACFRGNATGQALLALTKSRTGTIGNHTIVQNNDNIGGIQFRASDGTNYITGASIETEVDGTPGTNDMPSRLVFSTTADGAASPTERMRVTSGGGIGFGGGITIGNITPTSNTAIYIGASVISSGAGNSTLKYSTASGLVTYDTSSRLVKENITDCPYGIESVKQLQPRKYFRTDDQNEEIGFIADELVEVMPEFVPVGPKSLVTKNEEDTEEIPLGVNYEKLTAVLTSALQEAIAKIETLETKVSALESN